MPEWNQEEQEKPYLLVDFGTEQPQRKRGAGHDALQADLLSGWIELYLLTRTPLHVANGSYDIVRTKSGGEEIVALGSSVKRYGAAAEHNSSNADDGNQSETKISTQPVIPGSSFKGALRSLVEAISPSCVVSAGRNVQRDLPNSLRSCRYLDELCPACRLFGMSGSGHSNYMGQISVEDVQLFNGKLGIIRSPQLWAPARGRRDLPDRYLRGQKVRGRKIYRHSLVAKGDDVRLAIRAKSLLQTRLHFTNLTNASLGLLIAALGQHPEHIFLPKIGGGKPVGLGSVETVIDTVHIQGNLAKKGRLGGGATVYDEKTLPTAIRQWISAAETEGLLLIEPLQNVQEALGLSSLTRSPIEDAY